ncbi:AAA family ATPase [Peribacillus frigoritolerans]|uniref:AAA family ATPase n=1 Tax=Peribacillus frigoritolerans TaxID=450367 RepID=UPI003D348942
MKQDTKHQETFQDLKTPKEIGITNKEINVKKIKGINVKKFRNMSDSTINLANRITLLAGHNGTMKSTLVGLFVQPFNSKAEDIFGSVLKTQFSEIFKLSSQYDKEKYEYDVILEDKDGLNIKIPVYTKPRSSKDPNIRIVTGGASKSDGNLIYNTNYLNLNRLYSIHTSKAVPHPVELSTIEKEFVSDFYNAVLIKRSYNDMETVLDEKLKKTFGPANGTYNYESISSGEDNLGRIANSLLSFMRIADSNIIKSSFNGLLCIDEIEASLHPVAQINLYDFLYKWSNKYKVQILVNTHSLPLIGHSIEMANNGKEVNTYYLSTLYTEDINVIPNPPYETIYKELTFDFQLPEKIKIPKIDVICEDKLAIKFLRYMISKQALLNRLNFIEPDEKEGFPYNFLIKLCNSASTFVSNTIIIFDADVSNNAIKKIRKSDNIMRLPDLEAQLPIEKLLVKYLFEKSKNDVIYTKTLKMPKDAFLSTLLSNNIKIKDISDIGQIDTKHFKKWFNTNDHIVSKVFNTFSKNVNGREEFVKELTNIINKISLSNGYPIIEN